MPHLIPAPQPKKSWPNSTSNNGEGSFSNRVRYFPFVPIRVHSWLFIILFASAPPSFSATESPFLYGVHDHSPDPTEYLTHITNATGAGGWITATVAVGANPNDTSGTECTPCSNERHTV